MKIKYRADIDGLRGVAVLSIVFFHLNIIGFSGGFIGVDIFFVISGYLISSIIFKDINNNNFSITHFFERRIRRIFPALFTVILLTLIVCLFLFDSKTLEFFGKSVTASTLFVSNILYWRETDYFTPLGTKPLLHTWSLAVEEQFYIFFPLLIISINRFFKKRYFAVLLGICIISFLISIESVYFHKVATFYLLPTRAWELLFGAILSLEVIPEVKSNVCRNVISIVGLGLILFCLVYYSESTLFPGLSAILPVLGTGFIIYSGLARETTIVKKCLSFNPLVFIGLISYSIYLWHWPILVLLKYTIFREFSILEKIGIMLTCFVISVLSHKFIELPFRRSKPLLPNKKILFGSSLGTMLIFLIIGIIIYLEKGMPGRYPAAESFVKDFKNDFKNDSYVLKNNYHFGNLSENISIIGTSKGVPSFLIWGDSHAKHLSTGLSELGEKYQLRGYVINKGGVKPLLGMDVYGTLSNSAQSNYNQSVINFIKNHNEIKTVILAAMWSHEDALIDATGEYSERKIFSFFLRVGLLRTINTVQNMGRNIILVYDVPLLKDDPTRILFLSQRFNTKISFKQIAPTFNEYLEKNRNIISIFKEFETIKGLTFVHPELLFFDKDLNSNIMFQKEILYSDINHLTEVGSRFISPSFESVFKKMSKDCKCP